MQSLQPFPHRSLQTAFFLSSIADRAAAMRRSPQRERNAGLHKAARPMFDTRGSQI
jgi:hypothetical protein